MMDLHPPAAGFLSTLSTSTDGPGAAFLEWTADNVGEAAVASDGLTKIVGTSIRKRNPKARGKEMEKEKAKKQIKEGTKAVGAAGGITLQAGVAVPGTAPEPEFKAF